MNKEFEEYDVVKSTRQLTDIILVGTIGTIVIVHDSLPKAYEVEFVNSEHETIGVITVDVSMIEKVIL